MWRLSLWALPGAAARQHVMAHTTWQHVKACRRVRPPPLLLSVWAGTVGRASVASNVTGQTLVRQPMVAGMAAATRPRHPVAAPVPSSPAA